MREGTMKSTKGTNSIGTVGHSESVEHLLEGTGEISRELQRMENKIKELYDAVNLMREKLHPVLDHGALNSNVECASVDTREPATVVGTALASNNNCIEDVAERIRVLTAAASI